MRVSRNTQGKRMKKDRHGRTLEDYRRLYFEQGKSEDSRARYRAIKKQLDAALEVIKKQSAKIKELESEKK